MDDEPMWAVDRVVALTLGSAITIPENANEFAIKGMDKAKILRKWSKTGQTRTRERKSTQRAGILLSSQPSDFTLLTLTKKEQGFSITDCHAGNLCEISSDLTDENDLPMIGRLYGYDQEESVTEMRTRRFT
ncbi:hypothetical protein Tco_1140791 [Tanacetum coccineum]